MKQIFVQGSINPTFISDSIMKHAAKTEIGAHQIFLGQVRADRIGDDEVDSITYTAYEQMALEKMDVIREEIFAKYTLSCMHVYHSLGTVKVGELCLFVFTSSPHRRAAIDACDELVERIKTELPIWGKEVMKDKTYQWKVNK